MSSDAADATPSRATPKGGNSDPPPSSHSSSRSFLGDLWVLQEFLAFPLPRGPTAREKKKLGRTAAAAAYSATFLSFPFRHRPCGLTSPLQSRVRFSFRKEKKGIKNPPLTFPSPFRRLSMWDGIQRRGVVVFSRNGPKFHVCATKSRVFAFLIGQTLNFVQFLPGCLPCLRALPRRPRETERPNDPRKEKQGRNSYHSLAARGQRQPASHVGMYHALE